MNQSDILSIIQESFKSLGAEIEIVQLFKPILKIRVVAESYANKSIPERVEILTVLLRKSSEELSLNYAISFEPLTMVEYKELLDMVGSNDE